MNQKVALVTGASSGIGKATAKLLAENGFYVYAMARRNDRLEQIRTDHIEPIALDVADENAINKAVAYVISIQGRIDVLVNNAGYGCLGPIECVPIADAQHQLEINLFGYVRFMQAVLPHMRAQNSGCIINISSILGKIAIPGFGWYAASKYAVEALSEALRGEVKKYGIDVVVIAPGLIKTEFASIQFELLNRLAYPPVYQRLIDGLHHLLAGEPRAPGPEIIAGAVLNVVNSPIRPIRHALPWDSKTAVVSRWILGNRFFSWAVRRKMKI